MGNPVNNIHDKFFKRILSDKTAARIFIRTFIPEGVVQNIEVDTVKLKDTTFVGEELKSIFADIILEVKSKDHDQKVYCNLLIEHKSQPQKFVAFQLLSYLSAAYKKMSVDKSSIIPIIPILFYHGKKQWRPLLVNEYVASYGSNIQSYLPHFQLVYIDLKELNDQEIQKIGDAFLVSALLLQKYYSNPLALENKINDIFSALDPDSNRNLIKPIIVYYLTVTSFDRPKINKLVETLATPIKKGFMSTYDMLIEEGRKEGMKEGIEKGIEKGIKKGELNTKIATIRILKTKGFDITEMAEILNISVDEVNHLLAILSE